MRTTRTLALVGATVLATTMALVAPTGTASATKPKPTPANRVVIVLFDQMLPQYADQFRMPNYRELRDGGVNYKNAYLGYMASETVIAHNVIPSGLLPKNMGYTDEAYRDTGNLFGKGVDAMHITGDLSLADFTTIQKNHGQPYPKLADYLHTAQPGTKFITVGEKSYAVETATAGSGDSDIARAAVQPQDQLHERPGARRLQQPRDSRLPRLQGLAWAAGQERAHLPPRGGPRRPDAVRAVLHQLRLQQPLRHQGRVPVVALPVRRQPLLAGQRPEAPRW